MTTILPVLHDPLDVKGNTFSRTISLLYFVNGKKMGNSLVSEPFDDIPHKLLLVVDVLEMTTSFTKRQLASWLVVKQAISPLSPQVMQVPWCLGEARVVVNQSPVIRNPSCKVATKSTPTTASWSAIATTITAIASSRSTTGGTIANIS
jgi:hypothetical protein